jgi:hypothetical protein
MRKRFKKSKWQMLLAGGLLSAPACATPSTLGFYPSTDIYPRGTVHLDVDTYSKNLLKDSTQTVGLTTGIGGKDTLFGRTEIGVDFLYKSAGNTPRDASGDSLSIGKRLLFNVKTQLYSKKDVRLVAGLWGLGSSDIAAPDVGYVLASKTFSWGRLHLGLAHSFASQSSISTPDGHHDQTYLALGYDRSLTKKLSFAMDYYSGKSAISGIQPTFYYSLSKSISVGLGLMHFNDEGVSPTRNQVYLCIDSNFS